MDSKASKLFTPDEGHDFSENWQEQLKNAIRHLEDFQKRITLKQSEIQAFKLGAELFNIQVTPYYFSLINKEEPNDPIRKMIMPHTDELSFLDNSQKDPLGENNNRPQERIIHRYSDRVLFLVTDMCGIYCRYCTRKHFTGKSQVLPKQNEYLEALDYIKENKSIREVILSGGDPLTLSSSKLDKILCDLESIEHVELIRVGSRMPAACPMRLDDELLKVFKRSKPVYLMSHFNHPQELSEYTISKLTHFTTSGVPIFNQMVLLNGINNHEAIVYALSRKLLKARVFPYYMFQCDPSPGTDHLKTSIEESLTIQKKLWGKSSGLSLPTFSVDIPSGGGKAYLTPNFITHEDEEGVTFKGFDGVEAKYLNPKTKRKEPYLDQETIKIWNEVLK
jgi:lysine 2,3-aminomutase